MYSSSDYSKALEAYREECNHDLELNQLKRIESSSISLLIFFMIFIPQGIIKILMVTTTILFFSLIKVRFYRRKRAIKDQYLIL